MIRSKPPRAPEQRVAKNQAVQQFFSGDWLELNAEKEEFKQRRAHYRTPDGIADFAREVLKCDLAPYQEEILHDFVLYHRYSVRAPHGAGKSVLAAIIILWAVTCFEGDVKVPVTASAWRQLDEYLFPEVHLWAAKADWSLIGLELRRHKELLDLSIKLGDKRAFALASDDPALLEGAHATYLVYIFDEAKSIPAEVWDAAEGAFASGNCWAFSLSTPGDRSGRFWEIQTRKPGTLNWKVRHITLDEALAAGRIKPSWVDECRDLWGETDPRYQTRVLGEFADSVETVVIPLAWVELANERWRVIMDGVKKGTMTLSGEVSYGCDPAYMGRDKTAFAKKNGNVIEWVDGFKKMEPMQNAGAAVMLMKEKYGVLGVDVIGIGAGIYSRVRELGYPVLGVNVSKRAINPNGTPMTDRSGKQTFVNLRCAIWWTIREALDPSNPDPIALPPDDELTGDLTAPTWTPRSNGDIWVESKDEMKARLGRSPDKADSVGLALFAARHTKLKIA